MAGYEDKNIIITRKESHMSAKVNSEGAEYGGYGVKRTGL